MINKERLVKNFVDMVSIDSESGNEYNMQEFLKKYLANLGFDVKQDKAGESFGSNANNVIATKSGFGDPVILSAHMDTVTPGNGVEVHIDGDIISSKGNTILGGDDKGGIATIIEAVESILESGEKHPPLEIVFTVGEEGGLNGSKNLDYSLISAKKAIIFDTGGEIGTIITSAPGQNILNVKVKGKPAHAGIEPEAGISAIYVASHAISRMNLFRIDEETTCNIGMINGGVATNIVTAEVDIVAEVRSLDESKLEAQTEHIINMFEKTATEFNAHVDIEVRKAYNPFKISDSNDFLASYIKATKDCGFEAIVQSTGGGSDANNFNENGIVALNVSVNMCKVHTTDEYIAISDMCNAAKILSNYLINAGK
ncbi:MAG: M20/M25/M40 family metallo-hydrolase [Bacilli bacterium]